MYTRLKNVQIVLSLMKAHGIRHIVLSAGQSNYAIVNSVETDPYFHCYSVVDERSAAFFAMGLSQQLGEPVAISCTASTACCNYLSAVTEAYYQGVPLLVLTSSRNIRNMDQMELLMIHQENMFKDVTKKEIQLPEVRDQRDFAFCERIVNDAILELKHNGNGPVHIDIPSYGDPLITDVEKLPEVKAIHRHVLPEDNSFPFAQMLSGKKVMLICGQGAYSAQETALIAKLHERCNCVVAAEHMANLQLECSVNINPVVNMSVPLPDELIPDVIITFGRHVMDRMWGKFRGKKIHHWCVNRAGTLIDPMGLLTDIFQSTEELFLQTVVEQMSVSEDHSFDQLWADRCNKMAVPEGTLCHISAINELFKRLPEEGIIHYSIFNSIRISQHFPLPKGMKSYANMGALGIDGCLSTFLGQACACEKEAFLIIGDLSFFYDMNALGIRHIGPNVHIMLLNNSGGAEFYQNNGWYETIDLHTAARHQKTADAWANSCGFSYQKVTNLEELATAIEQFVAPKDMPSFLEVSTDLISDMEAMKNMEYLNNGKDMKKDDMKSALKKTARLVLGNQGLNTLKKVLGKG